MPYALLSEKSHMDELQVELISVARNDTVEQGRRTKHVAVNKDNKVKIGHAKIEELFVLIFASWWRNSSVIVNDSTHFRPGIMYTVA